MQYRFDAAMIENTTINVINFQIIIVFYFMEGLPSGGKC